MVRSGESCTRQRPCGGKRGIVSRQGTGGGRAGLTRAKFRNGIWARGVRSPRPSGVHVGTGLRPRPLSPGGDGGCRRIRRDRPMCRPRIRSVAGAVHGRITAGPPLTRGGRCSEPPRPAAPRRSVFCGAGAREWAGDRSRDGRKRNHQRWTIPQSACGCQLPLHTGEPWGRGMRIAASLRSSVMTVPDPLSFRGGPTGRRGNPFLFTMDGGSGRQVVGPYGWLREAPRDCRGSA